MLYGYVIISCIFYYSSRGILSKLTESSLIYRHEAKLIQKVIEEISLQLRSIDFNADEKLIGMETRVKDAVSSLEIGTDDVRVIGIKGMGGAGKTTLARAVFDQIKYPFGLKLKALLRMLGKIQILLCLV